LSQKPGTLSNFIYLFYLQDKIQCKGVVNFPNITLHCKDLIINCISGSTAKETLRMTNNGPIPVTYKFLWAGESIEIQREAYDVRIAKYKYKKEQIFYYLLFSIIFHNLEQRMFFNRILQIIYNCKII